MLFSSITLYCYTNPTNSSRSQRALTPSNETFWASDCSFAFSYTWEGNRKILNWINIIQTCLIYYKNIENKIPKLNQKGEILFTGLHSQYLSYFSWKNRVNSLKFCEFISLTDSNSLVLNKYTQIKSTDLTHEHSELNGITDLENLNI